MRDIIIETEAMSRFDTAVDEVAAADHGLSGFILAYGQAGRGKFSWYSGRGASSMVSQ